MSIIDCEDHLNQGMNHLIAVDRRWQAVVDLAGMPPLRRREGGFEGLAGIIVSQQLSVASARAIWNRSVTVLGQMTPQIIAGASDEQLREAGLSRPKQRTLRAVAQAVLDGQLPLETFEAAPVADIRAALTSVKGIGPWTADIYLMFCLGHADAFAPGDLALQEAAKLIFALEARPTPVQLDELAQPWAPWRAVAARLLWAYYGVVKSRDGINA
jgi:DNA-3-methyladenine glycosylase II